MVYGQTPPPARKSKKKGFVIGALILVIGVCLLLCAGIVAAISPNTSAENVPSRTHTIEPPVTGTKAPVAAAPTKAPKSSGPSATAKTYKINGDDVVHVGEDIPAGTYRAAGDVAEGGYCYWQKSSDSEGQQIISNGAPQGGRPEVKLKAGQWFSSQGCPDWIKR